MRPACVALISCDICGLSQFQSISQVLHLLNFLRYKKHLFCFCIYPINMLFNFRSLFFSRCMHLFMLSIRQLHFVDILLTFRKIIIMIHINKYICAHAKLMSY